MIQNVIRDMGGIAGFGIISVCLFFTVFSGAAVYALLQRKAFCDRMRALPLEDGSCSADFQSAVSQVSNLRDFTSATAARNLMHTATQPRRRLKVGDTAGLETFVPTKGVAHE